MRYVNINEITRYQLIQSLRSWVNKYVLIDNSKIKDNELIHYYKKPPHVSQREFDKFKEEVIKKIG